MRLALVGCGNVAARYADAIAAEPLLTWMGATDVLPGRAAELVERHGGADYPSLDALLRDDDVDLVVNLTGATAHAEVTAAALEARKHVHTEKPMAVSYPEAKLLVELAAACGVRLSCAPATVLGEAQQTMWKLVRERALGNIRAVYAEANWGRIETWHPSPETIYAAGPVADVGVYPLTIVTAMFAPVRRVHAYATMLEPRRTRRDGDSFDLSTPDFTVALLELEDSTVVRLTATFWVGPGRQRGLELHGDEFSLYLATWAEFDSRLEASRDGQTYTPVPLVREPYHGIGWARPLVDLAEAVEEGRPHRAGAEQAAHVVEVIEAIATAAREARPVEVASSFEPPVPMPWAMP
jgi:predicted dehydrogenase